MIPPIRHPLSSPNFAPRHIRVLMNVPIKQADMLGWRCYMIWLLSPQNPCRGELRTASLVRILCNPVCCVQGDVPQLWYLFFQSGFCFYNQNCETLRAVNWELYWFITTCCLQSVSLTGGKGLRRYHSGGNPPRSMCKEGEGGSMSQGILNPRAAEGDHKILAILGPKYFHWVTFVNWTAGGSVVWGNEFWTS